MACLASCETSSEGLDAAATVDATTTGDDATVASDVGDARVDDAGADSGDAGLIDVDVVDAGTVQDAGVAPDTGPTTDGGAPPDRGVLDAAAAADSGATADSGTWRSALYPDDWTPAHSVGSRFVHDFSYAGYHNSEVAPTATSTVRIDVTSFGADNTGGTDTTAEVQAAIDAAVAGGVVYFPAGLYRFDGSLDVRTSSVVLAGDGPAASRLYFTSSQNMAYQGHITFAGNLRSDLEIPLSADGLPRADVIEVADAADLAIGDDVVIGWVITPAFVAAHGMTGTWQAFNDTWQPFFRRQVVAVDTSTSPAQVTLDVPLRYAARVSDQATLRRERGYLSECGVEDLGVAAAVGWNEAWAQNQVHVIRMTGVADCWVRNVASFASPAAPSSGRGAGDHLQSGGIVVHAAKRVTVKDSTFEKAQNRGGGGNGYLFEVRQSSEVLFADDIAREGRHNFIQNWGFGTTGCVWLRVHSEGGVAAISQALPFGQTGYSEFHHSLATANLIDSSTMHDGWFAGNRNNYSTGAGHSATENVIWNTGGGGTVRSFQFRHGYVIGTAPSITVRRNPIAGEGNGSSPDDWVEGEGAAATLEPQSLFEDQHRRRTAP